LAGNVCVGHLDQFTMNIVGWMMMLFGGMMLAGEYLCVEVAWRCIDYNQIYTALGMLLVGTGMISVMIGANDDKTDLAGMGQGPGTQSQRKQS
jgi:hypothetical protein